MRRSSESNIPPCSGAMLITVIIMLLLMSVLAAAILNVISTGLEDAAGSSEWSRAFNAAETGISLAKAFSRSNSSWTSAVPYSITGILDGAEYAAVITTSPASMHVSTTVVWIGSEPLSWTGGVADGWACSGGKTLSAAGLLPFIQSDNSDGASARKCLAARGSAIPDLMWFSAFFSNDFPVAATSIVSARIYVDHEGRNRKRGDLTVHVSTNRAVSQWYAGGTGVSHSNSGNVAWSDVEQRYELDVTGLLADAGRIKNCEVLVLNRATSTDNVYLDYIYMTADYLIPPTPVIIVSTSSVQYAVISSKGRKGDAEWTSRWTGPGASCWRSEVIDGWACNRRKTLSQAGYLPFIRTDDGDAVSARKCLASQGDNISDAAWFSVYFGNDMPADISRICRAIICIDHQGRAGQSGTLRLHLSTNRSESAWYAGNTGVSSTVSADVAWNEVEQRYEYDVTEILKTAEAVNNCEVLVVDAATSSDTVYFDYMYIEAYYY